MSENKIAATMIQHIGTKLVKRSAEPMTKAEYNEYRGWSMPESEDPSELVYLVEYEADERNKPNHADHKGYISMSPKYVFDESYKIAETYMDRLMIEGDELSEKIIKLQKALNTPGTVPATEEGILNTQLSAMTTYLNILTMRIKRG